MKKLFTLLLLALLAAPIYAQSENSQLELLESTYTIETPDNAITLEEGTWTVTPYIQTLENVPSWSENVETAAIRFYGSNDYTFYPSKSSEDLWHETHIDLLKTQVEQLEEVRKVQYELLEILLSDAWNNLPKKERVAAAKSMKRLFAQIE